MMAQNLNAATADAYVEYATRDGLGSDEQNVVCLPYFG